MNDMFGQELAVGDIVVASNGGSFSSTKTGIIIQRVL